MKTYFYILALFFLLATHLKGQIVAEAHPYFLGHSLVNFDMPAMVSGLAAAAGKTMPYDQQIMNGAPLHWQWSNAADCQGTPYYEAFPNNPHDVFIFTEAIPLLNQITWGDTYLHALNFVDYARLNTQADSVRHFLYETWHCTNTGLPGGCEWEDVDQLGWVARLADDFSHWTAIAQHLRTNRPNEQIWMIPAGQGFANLAQAIAQGELPGINHFTDLFSDDIHLTNAGNYFVACMMFACIFRESPEGLPSQLNNEWGSPFSNMPNALQAQKMQEIAWLTALDLSEWTGVEEVLLNTDLLYFNSQIQREDVQLRWEIESQQNLAAFEIEYSQDGRQFSPLDRVTPEQDQRLFSYTHRNPPSAKNYYRLKMLTFDGSFSYSPIRIVQLNSRQWRIFPNPAKDLLQLSPASQRSGAANIQIRDMLGKTYLSTQASQQLFIGHLPAGIYLLEISDGAHYEQHKLRIDH